MVGYSIGAKNVFFISTLGAHPPFSGKVLLPLLSTKGLATPFLTQFLHHSLRYSKNPLQAPKTSDLDPQGRPLNFDFQHHLVEELLPIVKSQRLLPLSHQHLPSKNNLEIKILHDGVVYVGYLVGGNGRPRLLYETYRCHPPKLPRGLSGRRTIGTPIYADRWGRAASPPSA